MIYGTVTSAILCDSMWYCYQHNVMWLYVVSLPLLRYVIVCGTVTSIMLCDVTWYRYQRYIMW